jgi:hypothetical protein
LCAAAILCAQKAGFDLARSQSDDNGPAMRAGKRILSLQKLLEQAVPFRFVKEITGFNRAFAGHDLQ